MKTPECLYCQWGSLLGYTFDQTESHEDDITAVDVTQCEGGSRLGQVTSGSGFQSLSSNTYNTMWSNFIRNVASYPDTLSQIISTDRPFN